MNKIASPRRNNSNGNNDCVETNKLDIILCIKYLVEKYGGNVVKIDAEYNGPKNRTELLFYVIYIYYIGKIRCSRSGEIRMYINKKKSRYTDKWGYKINPTFGSEFKENVKIYVNIFSEIFGNTTILFNEKNMKKYFNASKKAITTLHPIIRKKSDEKIEIGDVKSSRVPISKIFTM